MPQDRHRTFNSPFNGSLKLHRFPDPRADLMAWDAADEYLLHYCAEQELALQRSVLVADDGFGALNCGFAERDVEAVHHSAMARFSAQENLRAHSFLQHAMLDWHDLPVTRTYDLIALRLPKSNDLLVRYCVWLRRCATAHTILIGAVMDKYLSKSMLEVLSRCFGPTHTTLGRKKARLTVSRFDPELSVSTPPDRPYQAEPFDFQVNSPAGVFAAGRLDMGTRLLLKSVAKMDVTGVRNAADLGCGNGVLGIALARLNAQLHLTFYDDSSLALNAAAANVKDNFESLDRLHFVHTDGLGDCPPGSLDLILCNPPFHTGAQQDEAVALRMFAQSHAALKQYGELWVVGNRHLRYHVKLKRQFGHCEVVDSNHKFVVFRCCKR